MFNFAFREFSVQPIVNINLVCYVDYECVVTGAEGLIFYTNRPVRLYETVQ